MKKLVLAAVVFATSASAAFAAECLSDLDRSRLQVSSILGSVTGENTTFREIRKIDQQFDRVRYHVELADAQGNCEAWVYELQFQDGAHPDYLVRGFTRVNCD